MHHVSGTYNTAKVFTGTIEDQAKEQIKAICDQEFLKDCRIRVMPDVHAGAGCTIGTTMTIKDKIVPNFVGVDIGCGMETIRFSCKRLEVQQLDKLIYEKIPSGMNVRETPHVFNDEIDLKALRCIKSIGLDRAQKSIGTLGGGNHFIEVDVDEEGNRYLVIHSGSRHLGVEVANYYQQEGYNALEASKKKVIQELIASCKAQGREREIQTAVHTVRVQAVIPFSLAYVSGNLFDNYIHDMKIIQRFAVLNRKAMALEIIRGMKLNVEEHFTTIHNYIDTDDMILRKGAVSAKKGEKLLIPINMRDGSLICVGKGNEDWNYSAPHGAGRLFSRGAAKQKFTVSQFKKEMNGIYTTSVSSETLDECPMAYKTMDDIVSNIAPTAEVVSVVKPVYNFKAGE
jgi:RNA-splicing ligase RtcB